MRGRWGRRPSSRDDRATPGSTALRTAMGRAAAGLPVAHAELPTAAARALRVADELGAPRLPALEAAAGAALDREQLVRAVEVAAAEGRGVARALVVAPLVVGPLTAAIVSDAPLAVWSTPVGRLVLLLALTLWMAGGLAVRLLVADATRVPGREDGPGDELLDLTAVALSAGASLPHALRLAGGHVGIRSAGAVALWLELGAAGEPPHAWREVATSLATARRDGLALADLVRSLAADRRRASHHHALQRAARLGARLTLPTALLLLPAAGLVVAAPLLHGLVAALG